MTKYNNYLNAFRYCFMIGAILGTLMKLPADRYALFILFSLLLIINMQLRGMREESRFTLTSIILEVPLILYLYSTFAAFMYFMLLVTLTDIVLKLKRNIELPMLMVTLAYAYCLFRLQSIELIFILALLYVTITVLLLQMRGESLAKIEVESLYDRIRQNNYELEAAQARLLDYSKQIEKITVLEERNRIARELHDSIGHSLAGILMQVDAAMQLLKANQSKGMEVLQAAYDNVNQSIETVRQTVGSLRPTAYQTHTSSLLEMIEKFRQITGVVVEYKTSGVPYPLFPSVEVVVYRNIQEALTNAVRHGQAQQIAIHLIFKPESLEVLVADDGVGCPEPKQGLGLSGMEERLELIGGSIQYSGDKGFTILMYIPRREM
ncbi:MAG TPA: sensor histidine kinase [Bacillota bacterium]|nr:sensor histidine kinase [Bacillota bacterium]